ncbi:MAG: M23 family metallopeptidase [Anaerolineales bacterium]|nr:M23 family metallopeptidase [Anaerolineales bacterium]
MTRTLNVLLVGGCVLSIAAATFVVSIKPAGTSAALKTDQIGPAISLSLPPLSTNLPSQLEGGGIARHLQLKTRIPDRPSNKIVQYTVKRGDSPSSIARQFDIQPETILWGNQKLNASVGILQIGDVLNILPVDGVLHTVNEGDALETLESLHGTPIQEILEYPGNNFDLTQPPTLMAGQQIIVPKGTSPILWSEAQAPGAAQTGSRGRYSGNIPNLGTGSFIWPVNAYALTQEYWSGHPGLDLATDFRLPIFASDSGTVVFSGWDNTGYGNMVIIDHGNGYQTYYSHNEANLVGTGQTVVKGQQIAESGNTGNSTGNHIDFRILLNGTFLNPFNYLP